MANRHPKRELVLYRDDSGLLDEREAQIVERSGPLVLLRDAETGAEIQRLACDLVPIC